MVWNIRQPSSKAAASEAAKDFLALNKRSVQSGLTTACEQTQFRRTHDIRRHEKPPREKKVPPAPPDITFGISTRPSTPVFELLAHRYQEEWLAETRKQEKRQKDELKGKVCIACQPVRYMYACCRLALPRSWMERFMKPERLS